MRMLLELSVCNFTRILKPRLNSVVLEDIASYLIIAILSPCLPHLFYMRCNAKGARAIDG